MKSAISVKSNGYLNNVKVNKEDKMAFIKINRKGPTGENVPKIINTDMICTIEKEGELYVVYLANGYSRYDRAEAQKIFDAIGISLD